MPPRSTRRPDPRLDPDIRRALTERVNATVTQLLQEMRASPDRQAYWAELAGLADLRRELSHDDCSPRMVSIFLHDRRRQLAGFFQPRLPQQLQDYISTRNLARFGDAFGPGFRWLELHYFGDHEKLIDILTRPSPDVARLNLSGFRNWLRARLLKMMMGETIPLIAPNAVDYQTSDLPRPIIPTPGTRRAADTILQLKLLEKQKYFPRHWRHGHPYYLDES